MTSTHSEPSISGSKCAAISNHVVRTMSEYTGRGPTKARTHIHDDVVTVLLQDTLTKGERSLVDDDLDGLVLTMRKPSRERWARISSTASRGSLAARSSCS